MGDRLPVDHNELRAWVLSEVTLRTKVEVPPPDAKASRLWLAGWATVILTTTIFLAVTSAPAIAYVAPLGTSLLAARARIELEIGTRRSQGVQRMTR